MFTPRPVLLSKLNELVYKTEQIPIKNPGYHDGGRDQDSPLLHIRYVQLLLNNISTPFLELGNRGESSSRKG